jgi:hypothetical protein
MQGTVTTSFKKSVRGRIIFEASSDITLNNLLI